MCAPQCVAGYQPKDPGLSVMLLLGVADTERNTGKCRSECEKIGTGGCLDSPSNETKAVLRPLSLLCLQETCKIRLFYRKLPLIDKSSKCLGWEG